MQGLAERIVALMKELRPIASRIASDRCERDYLVHTMVLRALRDDPGLSRGFAALHQPEPLPN
jgi:hypothetical protein